MKSPRTIRRELQRLDHLMRDQTVAPSERDDAWIAYAALQWVLLEGRNDPPTKIIQLTRRTQADLLRALADHPPAGN